MTSNAVTIRDVCVVGKSSIPTLTFIAKTIDHANIIHIEVKTITATVDDKIVNYNIYKVEDLPDDLTPEALMQASTASSVYIAKASYPGKVQKSETQEDDSDKTLTVPMQVNATVHVKPIQSSLHNNRVSLVYDQMTMTSSDNNRATTNIRIRCEVDSSDYADIKTYSDAILMARQLVSSIGRLSYENLLVVLSGKIHYLQPVGSQNKYRIGLPMSSALDFTAREKTINIFLK